MALALLAMCLPLRLAAQGVNAEVGHLFEGDTGGWTTFRLGIDRGIAGPVHLGLYGTHLRDEGPVGRRHWGGGADLVVFRGRTSGPYLAGGLAGGFSSDSLDDWWHSWSAGGGYQLVLGGAIGLAGEARWRNVSPGKRDGVELVLRLGALFGGAGDRFRARPGPRAPLADLPPAPGEPPSSAEPNAPPDPAVLDRPARPAPPPLATRRAGGGRHSQESGSPRRLGGCDGARGVGHQLSARRHDQRGIRLFRAHPARLRATRYQPSPGESGSGQGGRSGQARP